LLQTVNESRTFPPFVLHCIAFFFFNTAISKDTNVPVELRESFQKRLIPCFIDFSGGIVANGSSTGHDGFSASIDTPQTTPEQAIALRILARSLLDVGNSDIEHLVRSHELPLLSISTMLKEFAIRKRQANLWKTNETIVLFIHVDNMNSAQHDLMSRGKFTFIEEMLYMVGEYMCSATALQRDNVFVVPVMVRISLYSIQTLFPFLFLSSFCYRVMMIELHLFLHLKTTI
jgi:hypothetical protein